jgi:hypothetical protein
MSATVPDMSMSLDGYVTGPNDSRENPFGDGAEMLLLTGPAGHPR